METDKIEKRERIIFHFNKKHLEDSAVPMWVIKYKGESFYVHHLESNIGFSTKESISNPITKGSLMFKGRLSIVEKEGQTIAIIDS